LTKVSTSSPARKVRPSSVTAAFASGFSASQSTPIMDSALILVCRSSGKVLACHAVGAKALSA